MVLICDSVRRLEKLKESGLTRNQLEEVEIIIKNLNQYNQNACNVASKTY